MSVKLKTNNSVFSEENIRAAIGDDGEVKTRSSRRLEDKGVCKRPKVNQNSLQLTKVHYRVEDKCALLLYLLKLNYINFVVRKLRLVNNNSL